MRHVVPQQRQPLEYVAAGALDLLLSAVLFILWFSVDAVLFLVVALFTAVAGLVDLSVGWPRLRRSRTRPR